METSVEYFAQWQAHACVVKPKVHTQVNESDNGFLSSPLLAPVLQHPIVQKLDPIAQRCLLAVIGLRRQKFTERLEDDFVIPCTQLITAKRHFFELSDSLIDRASTICIDEAYHSHQARGVIRLHEASLKESNVGYVDMMSPFLKATKEIMTNANGDGKGQHEAKIESLAYVAVCETLITGSLVVTMKDGTVHKSIANFAKEHLVDESKHHLFFVNILKKTWASLRSDDERVLFGCAMVDAIYLYSMQHNEALMSDLISVGLSPNDAYVVVAETCIAQNVASKIQASAAKTLK